MVGTVVFQRLFETFGLDSKKDTLQDVHNAFIIKNSVYQKQCGSLYLSIERIENAIEDFDKPPLSFCEDKRERIQQLETQKANAEKQLESVESDMEKLEKVLKDIEKLYKCYEPDTYYSIHPDLKSVPKNVSPDLFKDLDEIEEYTPQEIDGSNLIWSVPIEPPKHKSYNKIVCPHCHVSLSTKQKLEQHLRKKKRCTDKPILTKQEMDELLIPKIKYVCNQCSKEYSNKTSLSRHKQTCTLHLKQSTQDALHDDGFVLCRFKKEKLEFSKESVLKRMMTTNYFLNGDINGARQLKRLADKYSRTMVVEGVRNKFFRNPTNYTYYQPHLEHTQVKVYQGAKAKVTEIKVEELIDHMVSKVIDSLLDTIEDIRDFDVETDDGEEVCTHYLYKFLITYSNNNDDDVVSKKYFTHQVKLLLSEYKDDIKQIWKHMKLI
jgi:uncharacterized FlaG/YvyC family protein